MSAPLQTFLTQPVPAASRTPSVVMGKVDYLSVLLRLVAMELYKLRRRALSKVLAIVAVGIIVLALLLVALVVGLEMSKPGTDFAPVLCSHMPKLKPPECINRQPTEAELAQYKQTALTRDAGFLRLPVSIYGIINIAVNFSILTPLIIILAGVIVGGEYSLGTVRLIFTRGPTRIQFLLAKLLAALICTVIGLLAIALIGISLGYLLSLVSGTTPDFHFFTGAWLAHALLYLLVGMLGWFAYAMVALFFGTLGRSTTAGVVSGLIWLFMEPILSQLLHLLSGIVGGAIGNFLKAVPDYLINNNIDALLQNQSHLIEGLPASSLSDLHALFVLAGYLVVFVGLSCWLIVQRDVAH
ncbi:MAG: ABC transporter permease [Ktedonobacteraceae bacterium]|nr:ABC transporter permease [Ktedonobacteraceae bacterium]